MMSRVASDAEKYSRLKQYVLTKNQLTLNEYPRLGPTPGTVVVKKPSKYIGGSYKHCDRCNQRFYAPSLDNYSEEECYYHPVRYANKYHRDTGRQFSRNKYPCCLENEGCRGCQRNPRHTHCANVFEPDDGGFVEAKPCITEPVDGFYGVYALDCEMVSTMVGMELARVTVINMDKEVVFETLVKPNHPVISYNTIYSGLSERDFAGVTTTVADVQEKLMTILNSKSILIGHGLHQDLLCMKIMHDVIVDTSVTFPHTRGYPLKKALKTIAKDYLGRRIQEGTHCSKEDAAACMDIMLKKIQHRY